MGVPGWKKGKVLRLSDNDRSEWCTDCFITILVDITNEGKYGILAKMNTGTMQLRESKEVNDVAYFGEQTCYKYYIQKEKTDVYVRLVQYSGFVSASMNPRVKAENLASAMFSTVG
jgi:hypothetical protein